MNGIRGNCFAKVGAIGEVDMQICMYIRRNFTRMQVNFHEDFAKKNMKKLSGNV